MEDEDDIKVWILKNYDGHNDWVLKHSIHIKAMTERHNVEYKHRFVCHNGYLGILALHPDVDVIFFQLQKKILWYHLSSGRSEEIFSLPYENLHGVFVYSPFFLKGLLQGEGA